MNGDGVRTPIEHQSNCPGCISAKAWLVNKFECGITCSSCGQRWAYSNGNNPGSEIIRATLIPSSQWFGGLERVREMGAK